MKKFVLVLIALLTIVQLVSCAPHSQGQYEFDPGETLSRDELESVFSSDSQEDTTPNETEMIVDNETVVYFTDGGTKYHLFLDCQSLSRSTNIKTSTLGNYSEHKKKDCCKYCAKRANISDPPAETT